jgi:uncharacterized integral membrane protein
MADSSSELTVHNTARLIRFVVAAAIVAALVLLGVDNRGDVRIGYVLGDTQAPVWTVLIAAAIGGLIVGWLVKHRPRYD